MPGRFSPHQTSMSFKGIQGFQEEFGTLQDRGSQHFKWTTDCKLAVAGSKGYKARKPNFLLVQIDWKIWPNLFLVRHDQEMYSGIVTCKGLTMLLLHFQVERDTDTVRSQSI
ncbi:unnamed protein product [Caretta caretta]